MARIVPATPEYIAEAAAVLRAGGLVALPTETVYGLGANALDPAAVARIFAAKGRPKANPVIAHIASVDDLPAVAQPAPDALALAAAQPVQRLLRVLAGEQELPQQRPRLARRQPRALHTRLGDRPRAAQPLQLGVVLAQVPHLEVVPGPQLAAVQRPRARERLDQRGLAGPVGPDQGDMLAALNR